MRLVCTVTCCLALLHGCSRKEVADSNGQGAPTPQPTKAGTDDSPTVSGSPTSAQSDSDRLIPGLPFPKVDKAEYERFVDAATPPDEMLDNSKTSKAESLLLLYGKSLVEERKRLGPEVWWPKAMRDFDALMLTRPDKACILASVGKSKTKTSGEVKLLLRAMCGWYTYLEKDRPGSAEQVEFAFFHISIPDLGVAKMAIAEAVAAVQSKTPAERKAGRAFLLQCLKGASGDQSCEVFIAQLREQEIQPEGMASLFAHEYVLKRFVAAILKSPSASQPKLIGWLTKTGGLPDGAPARRALLADILKSPDADVRRAAEEAIAGGRP